MTISKIPVIGVDWVFHNGILIDREDSGLNDIIRLEDPNEYADYEEDTCSK